ncbi:hypothetical protein F0562_001894 [Nyssa sinensis]|uniref:Uncharacterized protein n=1 Tax=Nyssa sinensis TaxID=561372 RepID=A0A5J5C895_9ASTE|nr:hypothetical protein F0562_001894 [Nyssa sinensis]
MPSGAKKRKVAKKKKKKEAKLAKIESNLSKQLREIVLSPQPLDVEWLEWQSHLADNEKECHQASLEPDGNLRARKKEEVQSVMELMQEKIEGLIKEESIVNHYGVRVYFIENLKLLSRSVRLAVERAIAAIAGDSKVVLSICVAYTSTNETMHAVQESCEVKWDEIRVLDASGAGGGSKWQTWGCVVGFRPSISDIQNKFLEHQGMNASLKALLIGSQFDIVTDADIKKAIQLEAGARHD